MRKPKVIIEDWTIEVKGRDKETIHVYEDSQEKKRITLVDFEENGMNIESLQGYSYHNRKIYIV